MRVALLVAVLVAGCAGKPAPIPAARNGLFEQMQACLAEAVPAPPCLEVDRVQGFVLLKDRAPSKPDAYLIVPTREVTGVEDPQVLRPRVSELWRHGWAAGAALVPAPAAGRALAINSKAGRSQDLLHIHISCIRDDVRAALAEADLGPDWPPGPVLTLDGRAWWARRVASLTPSPFLRLAELPGAREDMAAQSLAVVGLADGGFALLAEAPVSGEAASAEDLLAEDCS